MCLLCAYNVPDVCAYLSARNLNKTDPGDSNAVSTKTRFCGSILILSTNERGYFTCTVHVPIFAKCLKNYHFSCMVCTPNFLPRSPKLPSQSWTNLRIRTRPTNSGKTARRCAFFQKLTHRCELKVSHWKANICKKGIFNKFHPLKKPAVFSRKKSFSLCQRKLLGSLGPRFLSNSPRYPQRFRSKRKQTFPKFKLFEEK